jgi:hypothetical protein
VKRTCIKNYENYDILYRASLVLNIVKLLNNSEFQVKGKKKGKAVPVTGREGPQGCETLRLPHFI